jgi:LuxR family transcriptional regulator, quorum-sensing system regulator CciR
MSVFNHVQAFIEGAARSRDAHQLKGLLDEATRQLGFDYFALLHHVDLRQRDAKGVVAVWTYPTTWVDEYFERKLASTDPVHLASHRINVGFSWDRLPMLITLTRAHERVREQTRRAGIADGFTVPANIPGEANGSCSFAVKTDRPLPTASLPAAQLLGSYAFHAARRLVQRHNRTEPLRPTLTRRQTECLILMGRGSTDREIARALGLAEDTVTEYLDDARRRYDVRRRTTLILRAVFDGHIALSDVLEASPPLRGEA